MLLISLDKDTVSKIIDSSLSASSYIIKINLSTNSIILPDNTNLSFKIDDGYKNRIMNNLDDIELTLKHKNEISEYENKIKKIRPWLFDND